MDMIAYKTSFNNWWHFDWFSNDNMKQNVQNKLWKMIWKDTQQVTLTLVYML